MRKLTNILSANKLFLSVYALLFIIGISLVAIVDKPVILLFVNGHHNALLDFLMPLLTLLGEAPIIVFTLLFVLLKDKKNFWQVAIGFTFLGILVYLLKFHVFETHLRPKSFIQDPALLHFVEGVKVHLHHTFPSGHTTTAFFAFFVVSSMFKKPLPILICLILACAVAYSRMYLGQHFFKDVVSGSSLGILLGICTLAFKIQWKRRVQYSSNNDNQ